MKRLSVDSFAYYLILYHIIFFIHVSQRKWEKAVVVVLLIEALPFCDLDFCWLIQWRSSVKMHMPSMLRFWLNLKRWWFACGITTSTVDKTQSKIMDSKAFLESFFFKGLLESNPNRQKRWLISYFEQNINIIYN